MKVSRHQILSLLGFSSLFLFLAAATPASDQDSTQMVRLSFVEGDVRLSRGDGIFPDLSRPWQQAEANVLIEEGFSLATGSGRAEIEFENGSIVYLAPNSLLIFKNLSFADQPKPTQNGFRIGSIVYVAPDENPGSADQPLAAQIELATGTATIDLHPILHQSFSIETPGGSVHVAFPQTAFIRVDSYLDAMALTPQEDMKLNELASRQKAAKGQTAYFSANSTAPIAAPVAGSITGPADSASFADWDQWVSARVEHRRTDTEAALKVSGLSAPVPGLAELYQNGTFFPCAPYGTCWQPAQEPSASAQSPASQPANVAAQSSSAQSMRVPQSSTAQSIGTTPHPQVTQEYFPPTECFPTGQLVQISLDPATGKKIVRKRAIPSDLWMWPCREGSWIYGNEGFALVVRHRHHHHHHHRPPVTWVHVGKQVGYVPRHPKDIEGKPPINLKYGIFVPPSKSGETVKRVPYDPSAKMEILAVPRKQFRGESLPAPHKTERPEIEAHFLVRAPAYSGPGNKIYSFPILYDFKSQKFVEKERETDSHLSRTEVAAIFNSRGEFSSPETGRYAGYHFASSVSSAAGSGRSFSPRSSASSRSSSGIGSSPGSGSGAAGRNSANRGSGTSAGGGTSHGGGGGGGGSSGSHSGGGSGGGGGVGSSGGGGSSSSGGSHGPH